MKKLALVCFMIFAAFGAAFASVSHAQLSRVLDAGQCMIQYTDSTIPLRLF